MIKLSGLLFSLADCLFHIHHSQDYLYLAEMLDELQEHVESIDMANGKCKWFCTCFLLEVV